MSFTSIQTADGIFLVWSDVIPILIQRSSDGGETWESIVIDLAQTSAVDKTAAFDVPYLYRMTTVGGVTLETTIKRLRLNRYHYKTDYFFGDKPNLDLTVMARIQNVDENRILDPMIVTGVTRSISSVYFNDVTPEPVETTLETETPILPGDVILNTCIKSTCWRVDEFGFNFRDVFPGGFPAGEYIARYKITTTDRPDPIEVIIPFEVERVKEETQC